jgi:hypothetical protein
MQLKSGTSLEVSMQVIPLLEFYLKHRSQIEELASKPLAPGESSLVIDLVDALSPVVKKHYPASNAEGLLDDAVATLKAAMAS